MIGLEMRHYEFKAVYGLLEQRSKLVASMASAFLALTCSLTGGTGQICKRGDSANVPTLGKELPWGTLYPGSSTEYFL